MTYYRDHPHAPQTRTPLIDLIPDHHAYDLDVSDEEDDFYGKDDDFLLPAKWHEGIDQLPRRAKRSILAALGFALLFLISWWAYFGPRRAAYLQDLEYMDNKQDMSYGHNVRPVFKDMIQVKDLDDEYLTTKGKRLVFVGDVHGCREELEHLLNKVEFRHKHDHLVLVGDLITKGPDSPGVVNMVRQLGGSCVRGNWEDKLLLTIAGAQQMASPSTDDDQPLNLVESSSHSKTEKKLLKLAKKLSRRDVVFLQQCPVILRVGHVPNLGNLVSVHAGLVPDTALEKQDPVHVMNMRTIDLKTRIPSSKHDGTPWEKFWNHEQKKLKEHERTTVIYGHNRKRGLNIQEYTKGLDTGCVTGGRLTALVVDDKGETELVSVKCNKEHGYDED
ncbi:hypothetical protein ACEQ8H_002753 [Pleosporales sp. CAS-2024a]